jgi:putative DNA primase/helicase
MKMFDPAGIVDGALDNPLTEDALALRFSERHAHDLRYVALKNQWFHWDGTRWAPEKTHLAFDMARSSVREDAAAFGNGKPPEKIYTAKTFAAVHTLARADRRQAATVEQFDGDPWMLTARSETIDLRTGLGKPPDPADYITKTTACDVAEQATEHPLWTEFLNRVTDNNQELVAFLQRYLGYCLTGDTSEHRFVFAYGTGANGKSTLVNTVAKVLADYATVADVGTFLAANHERHPTDVAKLHGARFVVAQETEKGRRWDETKIKTMTGGDKMTARFMRQDFFDFHPTFKLFITGNNKPRLDNVDEAMRRRLLLVPFTVQIPPDERDPDLPKKLEAEWPAILRWLVDGCLEWQRIGLSPPPMVTDATAAYFDDQDLIKQWLEDCTKDGGPFAFTLTTQLFASWRHWCEERHMERGSLEALSSTLQDRGFTKKRDGRGRRGFARLAISQEDGSDGSDRL